jgi:hypothetical protein
MSARKSANNTEPTTQAHYLPVIHIPEVPIEFATEEKLTEYIEEHHHLGAVSHVDIVKNKSSESNMAFVHFKCPWNNGKESNRVRKRISVDGYWEERLKTGKGYLSHLPEGKTLKFRLIKSEGRKKLPTLNPDIETLMEQMELIHKLDTVKIEAQSALIAQLSKELAEEREKNRALERRWNGFYKTISSVMEWMDMNLANIRGVDNLINDE